MTENLDIFFHPDEYRFYHEEVRIETSQGDKVLLPIQGCPSVGEIKFPRYIDFGICSLDSENKKEFVVKSNTNVPFEYKLDVEGMRPEFSISPLNGIS